MTTDQILVALDAEIARLQQARALLSNTAVPKRRGRPPGAGKPPAVRKRVLSAAARERIAAAQRKRWAAQKRQKSVQVTRVAAKEAPKRRRPAKSAPRAKNALTGQVPKQPVAAKPKP